MMAARFRTDGQAKRHVAEMLQNAKSRPEGGLLRTCYLSGKLAPAVGIEPTTN